MPRITYDKRAEHYILDVLDLELDNSGHLLYKDGSYVSTVCGKESLRIDEVGSYAHDEDAPQETLLVCDNISCIIDFNMEQNR